MTREEQGKAQADLRRALKEGLTAYRRFRSGALALGEYVEKFGSFFYEWDLDGNESGEPWRRALSSERETVELLRHVQETFSRVYLSDAPVAEYDAAGRLDQERATEALRQLTSETDVDGLLQRLTEEEEDDG